MPHAGKGLAVGLFGGSFNPPHEAHRAASLLALKKLELDRVWWLVSPGNPLKDTRALPTLEARIQAARDVAADPRIVVTGIEVVAGTRYTDDTISYLRRHCPGVNFVWLMGADNLVQFHRWRNWRSIARSLPIAVIDRPAASLKALGAPAAVALSRYRRPEHTAATLAGTRPPAWIFLHGVKSPVSSTLLREKRATESASATSKS
jgi:nicotinate-nucleotide adenylyltransferase